MTVDDLFTREEVLGGLPGRKARALLFQIEIATIRAVEQRKRSVALSGTSDRLNLLRRVQRSTSEDAPLDGEAAWLAAFGRGQRALDRPSIRQIERYASEWAYVVPKSPRLRAAIAHLMGRTYRFTQAAASGIREALGLDTEEVQQAYQALYSAPLESIYAPQLSPIERLRWAYTALGKRLDSLPPFWMAFAFSLMGNFPEAALILPIAVATVGVRAGLILLAILGGANLLTIVAMAEAVARSGSIQYRNIFLGRLTANYLGRAGSRLVYGNTLLQMFLILLAGYVGISLLLAHLLGLPAGVWVVLFSLILIYRLWRGEQTLSSSSDLLLGGAGISLIVILSFLALTRFHPSLLMSLNPEFMQHGHIHYALLGAAFGGVLMCFCGHTLIPQAAKIVLHRDPSGHALIRGSMAGALCAIALQVLWLIAVSGAIPADAMAEGAETAAQPLGILIGPIGVFLGFVTVCLFIGLDSTGASDILFNLIRERLPALTHSVGILPRLQGRLLFHPKHDLGDSPRLGLQYLGFSGGKARFRIEVLSGFSVQRREIVLTERWEVEELFEEFPILEQQRFRLGLELLEADQESARFIIATPLQIVHELPRDAAQLGALESVSLSPEERQLLRWLMAHGEADAAEAARENALAEDQAGEMLANLEAQRLIQRVPGEGAPRYKLRWTKRSRRTLPQGIWQSLEAPALEADKPAAAPRKKRERTLRDAWEEMAMTEKGRFALAASPIVLSALVSLWLILINQANFAKIIEVSGVLTIILSSGIFPVLLLASCRQKGQHPPAGMWRLLSPVLLLAALYLFFLSLLFLHGAVLMHHPAERISAVVVGLIVVVATIVMARRGAFGARLSIEIREDLREGHPSVFRVVAAGKHKPVQVRLEYENEEQCLEVAGGEIKSVADLRRVEFQVPAMDVRELRVWTHRVTTEADSESLPALLEIQSGEKTQNYDLGMLGGQALIPLKGADCRIQVILESGFSGATASTR